MRFETATGIAESAWLGVYWRSWGDAVTEAGCKPNAMQGRLNDTILTDHFARLTVRLGRLPTESDLRMERRADPEFPSHNTFRRLGNRHDRIKLLQSYAETSPELAQILGSVPHDDEPTVSDDSQPESQQVCVMGHVYLIRMGKFYKVGRTNDIGRRTYELRTQMPERAELVHSLETDDPEGIERYWHRRFSDKRANGEWFELRRADVAAFKRRGRSM
ncbi:MAG: GIY-YIG nuclease family protein [Rhodococcus sp. (in: high G+C Gram-positive bacteria)]